MHNILYTVFHSSWYSKLTHGPATVVDYEQSLLFGKVSCIRIKNQGKNLLLAHLADLWEYGSWKVATFLAPHIQSSLLCAVYLLFSYQKEKLFDEKTKGVLSSIYFFWISMFLKTGVYWYTCSTYSTDCVEKDRLLVF